MLIDRKEIYQLSNRLSLRLYHFARGNYPNRSFSGRPFTTNRLFLILKNPRGNENYLQTLDNGKIYPYRENTLYCVPPFYPAYFQLDDELEFISIHANLCLFEGCDLFAALKKITCYPDSQALAAELRKLIRKDCDLNAALELKSIVFRILQNVLRDNWEDVRKNQKLIAPYLEKFDDFLNAPTTETDVGTLAEKFGQSREYFTRNFRHTVGITPKEFLDRQIAARAERLLLEDGASIKEIAGKLRFGNEFSFSRFFKRIAGVPPSEFRTRNNFRF